MDTAQKAVLKEIGGFLLITMGLFSDDESTASMAISVGATLMVSGAIDLLTQNNESNEYPYKIKRNFSRNSFLWFQIKA